MSRINCWFFHRLCLVHQAANTCFYCMSWPWPFDPSSILVPQLISQWRWLGGLNLHSTSVTPMFPVFQRYLTVQSSLSAVVNLLKHQFSTFSSSDPPGGSGGWPPSSLNYFKENDFTGTGSVILLFLSTNPCKLTSLGFPTPKLKTSVWMVTCGVGLTRSNKGGESIWFARCLLLVCHCWQGFVSTLIHSTTASHFRVVASKPVGGFCFEAATGNARSPSSRGCV